ncbi:MAG: serine hydrolase [Nocardioides sp.]|uniref:serine hydrolase domain-containing protein n=1 Tax=Nocardioides sp. TaxID=35761 RepID=UPI0039E21B49
MPATAASTGLADLVFTNPHRDPAWKRAVVIPAVQGTDLPSIPRTLEVDIVGAGSTRTLGDWVEETYSTSLLVLAEGAVVHEWYADGLGADTLFLGASMTKSVLAHLIGLSVRDGSLALTDQTTSHVPELAGSGYDGTTVLDLLTMTTGVAWGEDYRDPQGLAPHLLACFARGGDSRALLTQVRPGVAPGTRFAYCTADSQVLDWVRERATGLPYSDDVARLWQALGCGQDAYVAVDGSGVALAGGGLAATSRDWARVAGLVVRGRTFDGSQLLDEDWVEAAVRPTYPFVAVGRLPSSITTHAGFGFHWWPMDDDGHRVTADGSRGQFAATDRRAGAIVVKTSQWPYADFLVDRQARDLSYLGLHTLLDAVSPTQPSTKESSL